MPSPRRDRVLRLDYVEAMDAILALLEFARVLDSWGERVRADGCRAVAERLRLADLAAIERA